MIGKGNYRHFMEKEIHEQPVVIGDTLHSMLNPATQTITLPPTEIDLTSVPSVSISACGTAYYAGLVTQYWIERLAGIPVMTDIASEFRYRQPPMTKGGLSIFVSQSGETMDTLEASICRCALPAHCLGREFPGVEYRTGVARGAQNIGGTGNWRRVDESLHNTADCARLLCHCARQGARCHRSGTRSARLPLLWLRCRAGRRNLAYNDRIAEIARDVSEARDVLYLGRGTSYPIALERALKLKDFPYPRRRSLCGRRNETWPHRAR